MSSLKATVLGLGLGLHRANGYLQNPDTVLVAVCDTDANRLRAFTEAHPEVRGYADTAEMLRRETPDIVNVSTPDWMHLEHARQALAANAHVLLEKPMVTSLAEAEALIEAVERSGRRLMVGQNYRRTPIALQAKQLLGEDRLGTLFHAASDTFQNKLDQFARSPWYASPEHPRSALLGTGIHAVDLLRWLLGEVEEAFASGNHLAYPGFPGDDFVLAQFRFRGGVIGRVGVAYAAVLPRGFVSPTLELYGTRGTYATGRLYTGAPGASDWETPAPPAVKSSFWSEVDHFVECLLTGASFDVDVREGARNVAACLAAVEAMRTERPVRPQQF
jgi:UDP-N-acetylglucosamine 3-dehydrogenase